MQEYIVMEIQVNNGDIATLTDVYEDIGIAQQKYHTILAAAAVSDLPVHGAVILDPIDPMNTYSGLVVEQHIYRRESNSGQ